MGLYISDCIINGRFEHAPFCNIRFVGWIYYIRVMRRLSTGIRSEKCVVTRFHRCVNVIECTYTNLDSIAYYRYASLNDGDTF